MVVGNPGARTASNLMSLVTDLADAITRQEGANSANNNPGNLMDQYRKIWPQYPHAHNDADNAPVVFPDPATGRAALEHDLAIKINRGMTLTSLLTMYAPPSENDTATYIAHVSSWTGIPTDVPLNRLEQFPAGAIVAGGSLLGQSAPYLANPPDPFSDVFGPEEASSVQADVLPGAVSPEVILSLLIAGLIIYFLSDD